MARPWLVLIALTLAPPAFADDVAATAPQSLSVTLYRAPGRASGSITLGNLAGFALVKEVRTVHLPAGTSRLRFEGVVDGIEPASAIVTGLPEGVIEKNRDAAVLSPDALMRAAIGQAITLVRTDSKNGRVMRTPAMIRSADKDGVVFETAAGVEALHCSGLPETFSFARIPAGLSATPTLSVLTKSARPVTATVTLSYLASGFDWAADYVAEVAPGGETLDLRAWITLANSNSVGLPNAKTQVVAGRLNRAEGARLAEGAAPRVIARCWPRGTTSDIPPPINIAMVHPYRDPSMIRQEVTVTAARMMVGPPPPMAPAPAPPPPPPPPPPPEDLGDLKLYRLSEPTTIAARQMKQTRLLDETAVPFTRVSSADLDARGTFDGPATLMLRTTNDAAHHLGEPLPSGGVTVMEGGGLLGLARLRDFAEGEVVEIGLGPSPGIRVRQTEIAYTPDKPDQIKLTSELRLARLRGRRDVAVEITSDRATACSFELRLRLGETARIVTSDPPAETKDGRPIFRSNLPANGAVTVHYTVADR